MKVSDETKQGPSAPHSSLETGFSAAAVDLPRPASGLRSGRSWEDPPHQPHVQEAPEARWRVLLQSSPMVTVTHWFQRLRGPRSPWPEENSGLLPSAEGR